MFLQFRGQPGHYQDYESADDLSIPRTAPECHSRLSALGPDIDLDTAVEDQLTVAHVAKFQPHSRAQYDTLRSCDGYWKWRCSCHDSSTETQTDASVCYSTPR